MDIGGKSIEDGFRHNMYSKLREEVHITLKFEVEVLQYHVRDLTDTTQRLELGGLSHLGIELHCYYFPRRY